MDYLNLRDGEIRALVINSQGPYYEKLHWYGSKRYVCTGENCKYCRAGSEPRERYVLEVETDGTAMRWPLSPAMWRTLTADLGREDQLAGVQLQVTRRGTGMSTRYSYAIMGQLGDYGQSRQEPSEPDWRLLSQTLRMISDELLDWSKTKQGE